MSITVPAALRLALAAAVLAIPAAPAQAQSTDGPRTRITCDVQRSQRLAFVDNPMAAAGINRKITTSDDATTGRLEIVFAPAGSDGTMAVAATLRDAGKPASTRLSRHPTSEYMLFLGFDPEDGAAWAVSYFVRINKLIWTVHTPRLDGRDRAAQARTMFADCRRDELR